MFISKEKTNQLPLEIFSQAPIAYKYFLTPPTYDITSIDVQTIKGSGSLKIEPRRHSASLESLNLAISAKKL